MILVRFLHDHEEDGQLDPWTPHGNLKGFLLLLPYPVASGKQPNKELENHHVEWEFQTVDGHVQ